MRSRQTFWRKGCHEHPPGKRTHEICRYSRRQRAPLRARPTFGFTKRGHLRGCGATSECLGVLSRAWARVRTKGQRLIHGPVCRTHHRELHRYGDEACGRGSTSTADEIVKASETSAEHSLLFPSRDDDDFSGVELSRAINGGREPVVHPAG